MSKRKEIETAKPVVTIAEEHPFVSVWLAAVPICAFETADPHATIVACQKALNGNGAPMLEHDVIRGLRPLTKDAESIVANIGDPEATQNLAQCLAMIHDKHEGKAIFFIHTANRALEDWTCGQAIWNLRDKFAALGSILVLLGPSVKLPPELANDVPLFEEPSPSPEQVMLRIDATVKNAKKSLKDFPPPGDEDKMRIADTLTGYLSIFGIDQSLALSVGRAGFNLRRLWELKVANLKNISGLEISQPNLTFSDMAGGYGIKEFFQQLLNARERFRGLFWLEEIEKMLAGSAGDLSGTSQAMVEQFLFWTEAKNVLGLLFIGVPGAGKSFSAQCLAGEAKVPLLRGSMSSVKGSLVGQSEANMRNMLRAVDSVTAGKTLMIATCNSLDSLTPEIMARFKLGIVAFDFPTKEESEALWTLYKAKFQIEENTPPQSLIANWVPREIESCCQRAWLFNCTLIKAAQTVVPVCKANATKMDTLRRSMSGRFLSAAKPGLYEYTDLKIQDKASEGQRRFND